jgi:hypothetical protein
VSKALLQGMTTVVPLEYLFERGQRHPTDEVELFKEIYSGRHVRSWRDVAARVTYDSSDAEGDEDLERKWMGCFLRFLAKSTSNCIAFIKAISGDEYLPAQHSQFKNYNVSCCFNLVDNLFSDLI